MKDDKIQLCHRGRQFYADDGIVAISEQPYKSGEFRLTSGKIDYFDASGMSSDERAALADTMIDMWTRWKTQMKVGA